MWQVWPKKPSLVGHEMARWERNSTEVDIDRIFIKCCLFHDQMSMNDVQFSFI